MCSECHQYPCDPRCPNAILDEVWGTCDECERNILFGEDYYRTSSGIVFCERCISLKTAGDY